jgi:hypothetical protein
MDRPMGMRTAEARRLSSTRTCDTTKAAFPPLFEVRTVRMEAALSRISKDTIVRLCGNRS